MTLEEAEEAVGVLEIGPGDLLFAQVLEDRVREDGAHRARILVLPGAPGIDVRPPGERVEAVRERRPRMRTEPPVANGEITRQRVVGGNVVSTVIAHHTLSRRRTALVGLRLHETVHVPAVDLDHDALGTVGRPGRKDRVARREAEGWDLPPVVHVELAAFEAVDVLAVHTALFEGQAQIPQHVVEGPVLLHQDHDVLDVRQPAGRKRLRPIGWGLIDEGLLRGDVVEAQDVVVDVDPDQRARAGVGLQLRVPAGDDTSHQPRAGHRVERIPCCHLRDGVGTAEVVEDSFPDPLLDRAGKVRIRVEGDVEHLTDQVCPEAVRIVGDPAHGLS